MDHSSSSLENPWENPSPTSSPFDIPDGDDMHPIELDPSSPHQSADPSSPHPPPSASTSVSASASHPSYTKSDRNIPPNLDSKMSDTSSIPASSPDLSHSTRSEPVLSTPTPTFSGPPTDFDLSLKSPPGFGSFETDGVVLGVLLVNFNHLLGPVIEFSHPTNILSSPNLDPEIPRLLPFLALPDGAHLQDEDYSYFHLTSPPQPGQEPDGDQDEPFPIGKTVFGISCNRQLAASELLHRPDDVTRSTVQMAVVVLASQPVFGPIRDKLGVVTRAFFAQRDFTSTSILVDFYSSLQSSFVGRVSETTMTMGTSLRELVKTFRYRTLVLLKMLLLQKRIMFFGYPVERLCTYQYTLVSLIPGLLMNLSDCGSPGLDTRSGNIQKPTSLKTSDRASMLRFFGFPLDIFGENAFFQPYLPLQQIDLCRSSSWLVGSTNQIMLQQRDAQYDCLVNIEHTSFDFPDSKLERLVALTSADRKWMDELVSCVEETWNPEDPTRPIGMVFKGSDDYLRAKFEEYLCSALASMKFAEHASSSATPILSSGGSEYLTGRAHFSLPWLKAFSITPAYKQWDERTDPVLFDIWEPIHPGRNTNAATDIGLRLSEGIHDLRLEQNLAPAREAISSAITSGSTSLFKAFEGVRAGLASQLAASQASNPKPVTPTLTSPTTVESEEQTTGTPSSASTSTTFATTIKSPITLSSPFASGTISFPSSPLFTTPSTFFSRKPPAAGTGSHALSEGPSVVSDVRNTISERFGGLWGGARKKREDVMAGEEEMVIVDLDAMRAAAADVNGTVPSASARHLNILRSTMID